MPRGGAIAGLDADVTGDKIFAVALHRRLHVGKR
jgi:hypothetical protein